MFVHVLTFTHACDFCDEKAATLNIGAPETGGVALCTACAIKVSKELDKKLEEV